MSGAELLRKFQGVRAVVVGDLMLDEYIFGRATRVSQEAPVLVVKQDRFSAVPGGAANVAMNMMALGATVGIIGVVGADPAGEMLEQALEMSGIENRGVITDPNRATTKKTRVVANHSHQVLRIDRENDEPIGAEVQAQLLAKIDAALTDAHVLLLSDYQKGVLTPETIQQIIALAKSKGVVSVANAKPQSIPAYSGAGVVTLNRFEATAASGRSKTIVDSEAEEVATLLRASIGVDSMVVTLGGSGMGCASDEGYVQVPAVKVEVYDEAGAGDTVVATLALAAGFGPIGKEALELATHTAAAVVRKVGVAVPSNDDLEQIADILR